MIPEYQQFYSNFDPAQIAGLLSGNLDEGLNACFECCDRHANSGKIALRWEGENGESEEYSFADLKDHSARLASFFQQQGVRPGDRIACLLPRTPELFMTALAVWRLGAVYVPLFTAFGPRAIQFRLSQSDSKLIITNSSQRHKLEQRRGMK